MVWSQKQETISNGSFEGGAIKPWTVIGGEVSLTRSINYSGSQSLRIGSGATVKLQVKLQELSKYRLTGYLKTSSGSDEVRLNVTGLGEHNVGVASALTDWKEVKLDFVTGLGQTYGYIEIYNPENTGARPSWADELTLVLTGTYTPEKVSGIKLLPVRVPKSDLDIPQQSNENMDWLLDAKFGMFVHWGLYAGPGKGEWYMENKGISPEEYRKLAYPESDSLYFDAKDYDAESWATLAEEAGMKYMVMVTQHHDGYALFESKAQDTFTSMQTHNRDFVKEYITACRSHNLKVGLYKTFINWRYPGYYDVTGTDCKPNKFGYVTNPLHKENARLMKNELYVQTKELMTNYGNIDIIFWDGGWLGQQGSDADAAPFWESGKYLDPNNDWPVEPCFQDFEAGTGKALGLMGMVKKYQPNVIVNARSGWMGDFKSEEGSHPVNGPIRSEDVWEKCMSMAAGWGYTPAHEDPARAIGVEGVKRMLADCVIRNISLLLNVGPDRHGKITETEQKVLRETGKWLDQVGEAVYGTRGGPWNPKDGAYGYAYKGSTIYIYLLEGFDGQGFVLPTLNKGQKVVSARSVTDRAKIKFKRSKNGETVLSGFEQSDKVVTILAVDLNKEVMVKK